MEQHDDAEKAEEVTIIHSIELEEKQKGLKMPSDKEQAAASASSSAAATASTRPKATTTPTVAAAADSSRPSPKAAASTTGPSAAAPSPAAASSAASGTSGSTSSSSGIAGSSRSFQPQPVVLNTLRDPSHYEELSVIGNGETEMMYCSTRLKDRLRDPTSLLRGRARSRNLVLAF